MLDERTEGLIRKRHRAATGLGLRRTDDVLAIGQLLALGGDRNGAVLDADVLAAEPEQLAPAEPAERRHQHQGAVAGLYAVREVEDLIDGRKRSLRRLLHARGKLVSMAEGNRLVTVVIEVSDLERSTRLYRDGFGLDLHDSDHEGAGHGEDDRWISGPHAATTWKDGAFLHFALYAAKGEPTTRAQVSFAVPDLEAAHEAAVEAGAEVLHEARVEPWGTSARYRDYDGNVIELTQQT